MRHPDAKKRVDVFALSIYGLVVLPKALDMLMRQSLTCSTDLIRGLHQLIRFYIGSSLKIICH
ncbi:hypothetical protein Gotur_034547 [Gossypium turneri]